MTASASRTPTPGHFESKWAIEALVRASGVPFTIVRPAAFMELRRAPHFGLAERSRRCFLRPGDEMQFIGAEDIRALVATGFADRETYLGRIVGLAGDQLTGTQLADEIGRASGFAITSAQLPSEVLATSDLLRKLVAIVDTGRLAGSADIPALKRLHPELLDLDAWLARGPAAAIRAAFTG